MTEASASPAVSAAGAAPGAQPGADPAVYSKDYWDNVFEQVGRRPFVKFAIAVLALLYATAIYAPFIANDRPYYLEAVHQKEYERALKTTYAGTVGLLSRAKTTEAEFREKLSEDAKIRTYAESIALERDAFVRGIETLKASLPKDDHAELDELSALAMRIAEDGLAGRTEEATALGEQLKAAARELRTTHAVRASDAATAEGTAAPGKVLVAQKSWPLPESITSLEVFFAWLWLLLLTWPLWNPLINKFVLRRNRGAIRRWRRVKFAGVLGSSVVAAVVWGVTVGGSATFESADYKPTITSGELQVVEVVWAPFSMGFAETHLAEGFRPPTWRRNAQMEPDGFYKEGPRSLRNDETTGMSRTARPVEIRESEPELNSAFRHPLGTDSIGRDLLVRILYGGRISLAVGILSTVLLVFLGVVIGACAGFFGGWVDLLVSRLIEVFQSIPAFFLILTAVALIPAEVLHPIFAIVFIIALVRWTGVARLVRAEFLKLKEQEFVIAAQALGFKNTRVIFRHVLPNALGPVLVAAAFSVAAGILTESGISFLGLGIKLPIPSWGSLLNEGRGTSEYWWLNVFPGLLIFVTVFCYNVVGEGVRDALDPRRKV